MGNDISTDLTPPPLKLHDCVVDGNINLAKYYYYRRRLDYRQQILNTHEISRRKKRRRLSSNDSICKKRKVLRSVKKHLLQVRDKDGNLRSLTPEDTLWYILYVANPPISTRMLKLFRLRFRMPYSSFTELSNHILVHPIFKRWTKTDASGCEPSNMKLLLLGTLRYIGRGWTLDDICEANGISIDVNNQFLKCFIEYGSTVLYKKYVLDPAINMPVTSREWLYRKAGFNGCIGSTDATHVAMLNCPHWAQNINKGFKLSLPARTYNATVDHSRRILGSTSGHPGTWNDKTLVTFDELIVKVKKGIIPDNFEFKLYKKI